jgi:bifunctional non-homologous end joining protein LigD
VKLTSLDKILYPEMKITKAQVIEYHIKMTPKVKSLAHRRGVLDRFPNGVEKQGFCEKDALAGTPTWVKIYGRYSGSAGREIDYILCKGRDPLIWLGNLATRASNDAKELSFLGA